MKKYKEYMDEMTREGRITLAVGGILILLVIISVTIFYAKSPHTKSLQRNDKSYSVSKKDAHPESETEKFINKATESVFTQEKTKPVVVPSTQNTQTISSTPSQPVIQNVYASKPQEVKIALIIDQNEYDVENVIKGVCGNVYMITAYVPGPMVLTNSIKALFGDKVFGDFLPGNIIPTYHPLLTFKEVTITNGVARIYLNGKFNSTQMNSCDARLALAQLSETAKYYPTVNRVEIYQNGSLIN